MEIQEKGTIFASGKSPVSPQKRKIRTSMIQTEIHVLHMRIAELESKEATFQLERDQLCSEIQGLRRKQQELAGKYEEEISSLQKLIQDLRERMQFTEPVATAVKSSVETFTSLHKELQGELDGFQTKTVRRIRGREADFHDMYTSEIRKLQADLAVSQQKNQSADQQTRRKDDPWVAVQLLESKLQELETFNTQLLADNRLFRERYKDSHVSEELRGKEHDIIMQENVKLKKRIEELRRIPSPRNEGEAKNQRPELTPRTDSERQDGSAWIQHKLLTTQKELRNVTQELLKEREGRTALEEILSKCIEDVRGQAVSMEAYSGRYRGLLSNKEREQFLQKLHEEERLLAMVKTRLFPIGAFRAFLSDISPLSRKAAEIRETPGAKSSVLFSSLGKQNLRSKSVLRMSK